MNVVLPHLTFQTGATGTLSDMDSAGDPAIAFGPHNTVTEIYSPDVMTPRDRMYVTWFSAGLRAFDIRDPRDVKEIGWFLPPDPPNPVISQGGSSKRVRMDLAATISMPVPIVTQGTQAGMAGRSTRARRAR